MDNDPFERGESAAVAQRRNIQEMHLRLAELGKQLCNPFPYPPYKIDQVPHMFSISLALQIGPFNGSKFSVLCDYERNWYKILDSTKNSSYLTVPNNEEVLEMAGEFYGRTYDQTWKI